MTQQHQDFSIKTIPLVPSKVRLTSTSGLGALVEAFDVSRLKKPFSECLPERSSPRSQGAYRLGLIQVASFIAGHDCLADLEEFRDDETLREILRGDSVAPRTMGDFLRDFSSENLQKLNEFLPVQAKAYRSQLERMLKKGFKPSLAPHLSIDSTSHEQRGEKMEGVAYNYKNEWCLDSQVLFDELGFTWGMELRPGNTKSGDGAADQIRRAFADYKFTDEKYLSGDAAYCNQETIKTCMSLGVQFTFTANQATTGWEDHISGITAWEPWVYSEFAKQQAAVQEIELPEMQVGRFFWRPSWNEVLRIPVVVKRTRMSDQMSLFEGEWKHYGVVTNVSLVGWTLQELMEHHNKRGNAENFIREEKYGYDLKHFPCLEFKANFAYGALAMVAHNLLRWAAIHENPARPKFSKGIRRKFIHIPGKLVSHARMLVLRVSQKAYEEVSRLRQALELKPYSPIPAGLPAG